MAATIGSAVESPLRPRRRVEGPRVPGNRRVSDAASVEAWSGKDRGDENFPVGSLLIRRDLRPHVHAFYAFARNADDIADSPDLSAEDKMARLDIMEEVLLGRATTARPARCGCAPAWRRPASRRAMRSDLLIAFRRDATKLRYADWDELYDYCRYSAMPVGRHVLDLHGESHRHLRAIRRAVPGAAGAEPLAGLRARTCRR